MAAPALSQERRQPLSDPIKYSNVWEDTQVVVDVCATKTNPKILCIGSAGDHAFALLTVNPSEVVVVDRDEHQLYLIELKMAAIKCLDHAEVLSFLGVHDHSDRMTTYQKLAQELSEEARTFWNAHTNIIAQGILHSGKMERFFHSFRWALGYIHKQETIDALFSPERTDPEQKVFYETVWNNWRWRLYYYLVYNPLVFGRRARRSEYLKQVKAKSMSRVFLDRAHQHYSSSRAQKNHLAEYMIYNNFRNLLPVYLQPQHFQKIKSSLNKISLHHSTVEATCKQHAQFDVFVLSDIFEYMSEETFTSEISQYNQCANPEALFVYWNLLVDRKMHETLPDRYHANQALMDRFGPHDLGYFYEGLTISMKHP